jgi:hypothetical protein
MGDLIITTPEALEALITKVIDNRISLLPSGTTETTTREIIDTKTLCKRLGITEQTALRQRKRKAIPFFEIGTAVRYDWNAVVKVLEARRK